MVGYCQFSEWKTYTEKVMKYHFNIMEALMDQTIAKKKIDFYTDFCVGEPGQN